MIRKAFSIIAISIFLCIACQVATAQSSGASSVTIHGYVMDANNRAVPDATVNLFSEGASPVAPTMTTKTDASGYYTFSNLSPGNYSIDASRDYYVYTTTAGMSGGDHSVNLTLPLRQTSASV